MWRSQSGNIVLTGATRRIFCEGLLCLCADLEYGDEPVSVGLKLFDGLERGQQAVLVERVARAALLEEEEPPELHAAVEAAFVAVFLAYRDILMCLLEDPDDREPEADQTLVRRAAREAELDGPEGEDELDTDQWKFFLLDLAELFMWDADYEAWDQYADLPPEQAATTKAMMGLSPGYFDWQPPDASDTQVKAVCERVLQVVRSERCPE